MQGRFCKQPAVGSLVFGLRDCAAALRRIGKPTWKDMSNSSKTKLSTLVKDLQQSLRHLLQQRQHQCNIAVTAIMLSQPSPIPCKGCHNREKHLPRKLRMHVLLPFASAMICVASATAAAAAAGRTSHPQVEHCIICNNLHRK